MVPTVHLVGCLSQQGHTGGGLARAQLVRMVQEGPTPGGLARWAPTGPPRWPDFQCPSARGQGRPIDCKTLTCFKQLNNSMQLKIWSKYMIKISFDANTHTHTQTILIINVTYNQTFIFSLKQDVSEVKNPLYRRNNNMFIRLGEESYKWCRQAVPWIRYAHHLR